jgi:ribosomal protein S18 acetylase RimI-like enzyme
VSAGAAGGAAIRLAGPADLPAIAALAGRVWRAHYPGIISPAQIEYMLGRMYAIDELAREMTEEGIRYACAEEGGALIAFVSWGPPAPRSKLHKLYVDPARQRRGVGSRLLAHVEGEARAAGARRLFLKVNKRNAQAIAAYRRAGYEVAAATVVDIGGGFVMDDWVMEKGL